MEELLAFHKTQSISRHLQDHPLRITQVQGLITEVKDLRIKVVSISKILTRIEATVVLGSHTTNKGHQDHPHIKTTNNLPLINSTSHNGTSNQIKVAIGRDHLLQAHHSTLSKIINTGSSNNQ